MGQSDFRGLNGVTKKDQFPIPHMDECIDALDGNIWFSKVDAANAYWQVPLDRKSCEKTAFRTKKGLFEFTRLPFGLVNAPTSFSRAMALILKGLNWKVALSFFSWSFIARGLYFTKPLKNVLLNVSSLGESN